MLHTSLKFVPKIGRHWTMESCTFKYRLESHTLMIIDSLMYQVSAALMTGDCMSWVYYSMHYVESAFVNSRTEIFHVHFSVKMRFRYRMY